MCRCIAAAWASVQAFNSVQVRSRVDGTLMQVPVTEGQEVKQGDILAVIDPRPYQAALDAAHGEEAQDEAELANAQARPGAVYLAGAEQDFASHQQVDTQQAMVNQLTATIAGDDAAIDDRAAEPGLLHHHLAVRRTRRACARSIRATWCTPPTRPAS